MTFARDIESDSDIGLGIGRQVLAGIGAHLILCESSGCTKCGHYYEGMSEFKHNVIDWYNAMVLSDGNRG
jgi:hypothetical protein